MTRLTKTETVPASTREIAWYRCDLCGAESDTNGEWPDGLSGATYWEVTIESKRNRVLHDGGYSDSTRFDCCQNCFRDKVRPALVELGLKARKVRVEF